MNSAGIILIGAGILILMWIYGNPFVASATSPNKPAELPGGSPYDVPLPGPITTPNGPVGPQGG